ncbi:MAG: ribose 5-phosphate isomerase B, partial [Deferribacteraceae bacterium]|nr:ribose 5-phosphate isomerase B [Deferribacteraceae bacterium]
MHECSDNMFKIVVSSDHGGAELKSFLKIHLESRGYSVSDFGVQPGEKSDYPDMALPVADAIIKGVADRGILLCGTGIGMSIAANRIPGIRAALCHDDCTARMSRRHNDANVLIMGGRILGVQLAVSITDVWLETDFDGG